MHTDHALQAELVGSFSAENVDSSKPKLSVGIDCFWRKAPLLQEAEIQKLKRRDGHVSWERHQLSDSEDAEDQDSYLQPKSGKLRGGNLFLHILERQRGHQAITALGKGSPTRSVLYWFRAGKMSKLWKPLKGPGKTPFSQLSHQETLQKFALGFFCCWFCGFVCLFKQD